MIRATGEKSIGAGVEHVPDLWSEDSDLARDWRHYTNKVKSPTDFTWSYSSPENPDKYINRFATRNNWLNINNDDMNNMGVFQKCKYDEECNGLCVTHLKPPELQRMRYFCVLYISDQTLRYASCLEWSSGDMEPLKFP